MYNTIGMPEFYQEAKRKLPIIDVREEMEYQLGMSLRPSTYLL